MARTDKETAIDRNFAVARLGAARAFLQQAEMSLEYVEGIHKFTTVVSSAILAGIAASDAACGFALGRISQGEHARASTLLKKITGGNPAATKFARLVAQKTPTQYTSTSTNEHSAHVAITHATFLIEFAESHERH